MHPYTNVLVYAPVEKEINFFNLILMLRMISSIHDCVSAMQQSFL